MAVNYEAFLSWAEKRFDNIKANGKEVMVSSPFPEEEGLEPDYKTHLWCNVEGGKHQRGDGVYRCWKTDKVGTLTGLVMKVEGCTYEEAVDILGGTSNRGIIEQRMENFFQDKDREEITNSFYIPPPQKDEVKLKLPDYTYPLTELVNHPAGKKAIEYLKNRELSYENLNFCTRGKYNNRIVIPYYGKQGDLIYYNCRDIGNRKQKYLGPPKEIGIGKGDVLFMTSWPNKGDAVYLCEGELDALTLAECGLNAAAVGGKFITIAQIELLRGYKIVLALDNDPVGIRAVLKEIGNTLLAEGFSVNFVIPPDPYKDWNEMLQGTDKVSVFVTYLKKSMRRFEIQTGSYSNIVWKL